MITTIAMKNTMLMTQRKLQSRAGVDLMVLSGGVIVYVGLTFLHIASSSIWFDEAFSAYMTRFNFFDIAKFTAFDVHPPMYYWVLKLWTMLFGTTEVAFRSLSVLFGAVAIVFGALLVKKLFGRKAAAISLLLLVISPMLIRYGEEARMYTMAAAITLAATYVLTIAVKSEKRRKPWIVYGALVSLGMWTHYFTALIWLSHWAWRYVVIRQAGKRKKELRKAFFSKNWIFTHKIAVGFFIPWALCMLIQLVVIQAAGYWIGPISVSTFTNYITNVLFYLEHEPAVGLYGTATAIVIALLSIFGLRLYRTLNKKNRQSYLLITFIAFIPVILLFIASTPPMHSSFVERYLIPAVVGFSLFAGVTLALGFEKLKAVWRYVAIGVLAVCMLVGVSNVYYYGNYNKNSQTKVTTGDVVKEIQARAKPGEPIIASDPWVYYEAVFYDTADHPVYFIDASTDYKFGSLKMLKDSDFHKIKDLSAFSSEHPTLWYMGYSDGKPLSAPVDSWKEIQKFSISNNINNRDQYKAVEFKTN
jgi:uncharacterized membrane protein